MKQSKKNISRWYSLGMAALLLAACLLLGVGTTLARYRTDAQAGIIFEPREPITVTLGKMNAETGEFDPTAPIGWERQADGSMRMNFVVSNQDLQEEPLEVRVRLLGSLHAWDEMFLPTETEETEESSSSETTESTEETLPDVVLPEATVTLTDGTVLEDGEEVGYTADIIRIPENSALYHTFGDGWLFRFLDEEGKELTWILEDGTLSCVEMNISISAEALNGTSLLQLQVIAVQTD